MSLDTQAEHNQSVHIPREEENSCEINAGQLDKDIFNSGQSRQFEIDSITDHSLEDTHIDDEEEQEEHREYYEDQSLLTQMLASHHTRNNYSQDTQVMNDEDDEAISMDIEGNSTQKSKIDYTNKDKFDQLQTQDDPIPTQLNFGALVDTQLIPRNGISSIDQPVKHRLEDLKDTQIIGNGSRAEFEQLQDTQPITKDFRQRFRKSRSRYDDLAETQVIIRRRTQNLPETQVINFGIDLPHVESSESFVAHSEEPTQENDDTTKVPNIDGSGKRLYDTLPETQVINKPILFALQEGHISETDSQNPFIVKSQANQNYQYNNMQLLSHRQVINTQDEPDTSLYLLKPNTLEVQTDEEKDSSNVKVEDDKEAVGFDDSKDKIDHDPSRQKRKLSHSPTKIKRSKTANIENYGDGYRNHNPVTTPGHRTQLRNHSEPLVFASPFDKTFSTSSSSPSKKIADQLVRTDEDHTQADTSNDEEGGDVKVENDSKSDSRSILDGVPLRHVSPPSSPDGINSLSLSESEEEEDDDLDADYTTTSDVNYGDTTFAEKTASDERRIVPKRRVNNIIDSQTPSCDNNPYQQDDENIVDGVLRKEQSDCIYEEDIICKDSVWATYNLKMYSGYISSRYGDYSIVDFEQDSSRIKNEDLNPLDIRIGDTLNVKDKRFKCVVTGLSTEELLNGIRCIRGYNVIHYKRNSKSRKSTENEEFVASISQCSMELGDWVMHQQKFQIKRRCEKDANDTRDEISATPNLAMHPMTSGVSLAYPSTPSKLSRHSTMIHPLSPSPKKGVTQTSQLFANSLFCITNIDGQQKHTIKNLIESNGGTYLDTNLMDLFQYMQRPQEDKTGSGGRLYLKSSYSITSELTFVALISNNFCRSSKYLQALALGWPILSESYINDVINGVVDLDQWPAYCLPAGQSTKLNTVANCDLYQFRRNYELGQCLDFQMDLHADLLGNCHVVMTTASNIESTKKSIIEMDTCRFIFHAFGASSLNYAELSIDDDGNVDNEFFNLVKSLHGGNDNGDILICDYGNNQIADALYKSVDGSRSFSDKSKRVAHRSKLKKSKDIVELKIVNWEWVVQCVISGHIWHPPVTIKINT